MTNMVLKIGLMIFLVESLIMGFFHFFHLHHPLSILIDAFVITMISAPIIYWVIIKPAILEKTNQIYDIKHELEFHEQALNEHAIVSITDIRGKITYANDKFYEISGYSCGELLGQNHRVLKSDEHSLEFYEDLWATISSGNVWHGEIKNNKKNGDCYWVAATIVPQLNENGKPYRYISVRTDITTQKKTQLAAEEANHTKARFLGTMGHELRTPLNAIIGFSDAIINDDTFNLKKHETIEYAGYVNASGLLLLDLINDILDTAKGELEQIQIQEMDTIIVAGILEPILSMFSLQINEKGIELKTDIEPGTIDMIMMVDPIKIKQVISNLLSNAIKFSDDGVITVSTWVNTNGLYLSIEDTGGGIKEDDLPRLFSAFFRTDEAANINGSGLGLSISKKIIELHGGDISVSSVFGEGSTFTIFLPKSRTIIL